MRLRSSLEMPGVCLMRAELNGLGASDREEKLPVVKMSEIV